MGLHAAFDIPNAEVVIEVRIEADLNSNKAIRLLDASGKNPRHERVRHFATFPHEADDALVVRDAQLSRKVVTAEASLPNDFLWIKRYRQFRLTPADLNFV